MIAALPICILGVSFSMGVALYPRYGNEYTSLIAMIVFELILMIVAFVFCKDKKMFIEIYTKSVDGILLIAITGVLVVLSELEIIKGFITVYSKQDFLFFGVLATCQKLFIELCDIHIKAMEYKWEPSIPEESGEFSNDKKMIKDKIHKDVRLLTQSKIGLSIYLFFGWIVIPTILILGSYYALKTENILVMTCYVWFQIIVTVLVLFIVRKGLDTEKRRKIDMNYSVLLDILLFGIIVYVLIFAHSEVLKMSSLVLRAIGLSLLSQKIFYILLKSKNKWQKT